MDAVKTFGRGVLTLLKWLLVATVAAMSIPLVLIAVNRADGIGVGVWFLPLAALSALFVLGVSFVLFAKSNQLSSISLSEAVQAISAFFSTILVILGLFFVVSEFGRQTLDRQAEIASASRALSATLSDLEIRGFRLALQIERDAESSEDLAADYRERLEGFYDELVELKIEAESCVQFRTCEVSNIRDRLCQLGEPFGYFNYDVFYPTGVQNISVINRLEDRSSDLIYYHCSLIEAVVFSINRIRDGSGE